MRILNFFKKIKDNQHLKRFITLKENAYNEIMSMKYTKPSDYVDKYMASVHSFMSSEHTTYVLNNIVVDPDGRPDKEYIFRELKISLGPCISAMPKDAQKNLLSYIQTNHNFRHLQIVDTEFVEAQIKHISRL
ncbi:MAG: hypothetical protein ABJH06_17900 [Paraglaciecola sp.]|uniref:hypothetical protein n=1 Tax=Paraglaciecola sp. TaxID=1920173 RepID=UPI003297658F